MSQLVDIFLEPAKAWSGLKERPTFLVPALLVAVLTTLAGVVYFFHVDPAWFADYQLAQVGKDMSASEIEQMRQFMPGARTLGWITAVTTLVALAFAYTVLALYYLLAGKVTGNDVGFRRGLALTAWASLPMLIGAVVSIIATYTSAPQSSYESMQMLNVDPLIVQLPIDHDWSRVAKSFSLLNFWVWFLAALGWKTWFRTGWGQALAVVMLPGVVIFGVMALFALL